jgi:hypothetical protein
MAATRRRRAGMAGAAAAGMLVLGGPASLGAAPAPTADAPHGQLLQAADGTLYLLVGSRAHPITPASLTDEALAVVPVGEPLPEGAFWLVPAAGATPHPAATATAANAAPFFATQTAVAPRGSSSSQRVTAAATAQAVQPRPAVPAAVRAIPAPGGRPLGQS